MSDNKEVLHGQDAIAQVEQNLGRPLTYAEKRVVEEEGYVATPYTDTKGVTTFGVGQTGRWIEEGFEPAFQHHVDRARARIPKFDKFPEELQAELIQAEYRGDLGHSPTFVRLMNEGNYQEASQEFLDNNDYRKSQEEMTGVHGRMKRVSDAVASFGAPAVDEKGRVVPEATTAPVTDFRIGTSGYSFIDGDTVKDDTTGERIRLREIDLAELTKVTREGGYSVGEGAGQVTKEYVAHLANKYGYTQVKAGKEKDDYGRRIGDLVDEEGNSFTDFLISQGIARPTFIGRSTEMMSDESYDRFVWGESLRSLRGPDTKRTDIDVARELIQRAALDPSNGVPLFKQKAFNEEEFASFPELFSGVVLRNKNATFDNRSKTPFSDSFGAGVTSAVNSFRMAGAAMADTVGADDAQAWFEGGAAYHRSKLADAPKVRLSYEDVDWSSFGQVTEFLGSNIAMSLPYMGVTMASVVAAPFTFGTSLTVPVAMYSGMILDEMPGKMEDKSYGVALAGGAIAASLDRLGLKAAMGSFTPKHFLTGEAKDKAIDAIQQAGLAVSREEAEQVLSKATKRELLGYLGDASNFMENQITKSYILKQFAKRMSVSGGMEGGTEMLQELTQYTSAVIGSEKTWDYDELEERMANAAIAGGMIGSSFSVPSTAFQAGQWKDAGVAKSDYDKRFDDATAGFRADERAKTATEGSKGYVPDIQTKLSGFWDRIKSKKVDRQEKLKKGTPVPDETTLDDFASESDTRRDARPTSQKLKDILKDPVSALRSSLDTRITIDMLNSSPTLRLIYDGFAGKKNKTHGGIDFQNDKLLNFTHFEKFLRPIEEILNDFKVKGRTYGKRRTAISTLVQKFYEKEIRPITKRDSNKKWKSVDDIFSQIDWNNVSDPAFVKNKDAIETLVRELYTVDDAMYRNITAVQEVAGERQIGELQDHIFRSKGFLKKHIGKKKEEFTNLLAETYGLSRDVAASVTDSIIDNPEVNTLDEAFDLTKGGIVPKGHKRRSLNLADNPEFSEFLEQDVFRNLEFLMKGSARYMTMTKFIGRDSVVLMEQLRDVYRELRGDAEEGSPKAQAALELVQDLSADLRDLINADSGNYKRIENDALRGAQKFATLAATLTMLPLSAISSTVELALVTKGTSLRNMHQNTGSFGILLGKEMYEYFREVGRLTGVTPKMSTFDWQLSRAEHRVGEDRRHIDIKDPRKLIRNAGFLSQKTGAAAVTGVSESNQFTETLMNSFFKMIGLQGITNLTRTMRAAMWNDFLIENLDIIHMNEGKPETNESAEAEKMLRYMGIPVDKMLALSLQLKIEQEAEIDSTPELLAEWEAEFNNGLINFVNASVPMPGAMSRPLFYSNPHFAMFTQFQGFISEFTANHIPHMYDTMKTATPGMKFSVFSSMVTMLMLGYASQYLKDLIKFGEGSPYLSDQEKYLRALYSTGLLGTTERVWGNNFVFPLYKDRSRNTGEAVWNLVSGEAPASGLLENIVGFGRGVIEGDSRSMVKRGVGMTPMSPLKHRIYDTSVENGWIIGE